LHSDGRRTSTWIDVFILAVDGAFVHRDAVFVKGIVPLSPHFAISGVGAALLPRIRDGRVAVRGVVVIVVITRAAGQ
jgi:hypothetical protein